MRNPISTGLGALAFVAMGLASAQALPVAPDALRGSEGSVTLVRDGCGPYGHRSHYGYCKQNGPEAGFYGPRPFFGGPGYGPPRGYGPRRCFIRDTYYGPRRVCRW